jgi:hypothetical protein
MKKHKGVRRKHQGGKRGKGRRQAVTVFLPVTVVRELHRARFMDWHKGIEYSLSRVVAETLALVVKVR